MLRWLEHPADFPGVGFRADDVVADVGCGLGEVTVAAARSGAEVRAFDVTDYAVERTRHALEAFAPGGRAQVTRAECPPIPLPDGAASVVVCTEVLEHVPDPPSFVAELARVARPGARILISVPDPCSERLMATVAPPEYFQSPGHLRVYEHEALDALLERAGLVVVDRPVYPHNFYWTLYWTFGWASGAREFGPSCHVPPPPILERWRLWYMRLLGDPRSAPLIDALDRVVCKSQVVVSRKPAPMSKTPTPFQASTGRRSAAPARPFVDDLERLVRCGVSGSPKLAAELSAGLRIVWAEFRSFPGSDAAEAVLNAIPIRMPQRLSHEAQVVGARLTHLKHSIRDGSIRLAGYDVSWSIRRARARV